MHIESPGCIRPGRRPHIGSWDNISSVSPSGNPSGKHSGYSGRSFRVENCHSAGANVARNPEHACALFPLSCIDFSACLICHRRTNGRPRIPPRKGDSVSQVAWKHAARPTGGRTCSAPDQWSPASGRRADLPTLRSSSEKAEQAERTVSRGPQQARRDRYHSLPWKLSRAGRVPGWTGW